METDVIFHDQQGPIEIVMSALQGGWALIGHIRWSAGEIVEANYQLVRPNKVALRKLQLSGVPLEADRKMVKP